MVTPLENFTPIYLNSGGGMFGAVRNKLRSTPSYEIIFGDRVFPGRAPKRTPFPYVVMTHVSCIFDDYMGAAYSSLSLPLDTWKEMMQISVYADSYEAARTLAKYIHAVLSRHILVADAMPCYLYPEARMIMLDQNRSGRGGDIWHVDHRYSYWISEWIFPDDYEACPVNVPFNTIWPEADSAIGPPWDF